MLESVLSTLYAFPRVQLVLCRFNVFSIVRLNLYIWSTTCLAEIYVTIRKAVTSTFFVHNLVSRTSFAYTERLTTPGSLKK